MTDSRVLAAILLMGAAACIGKLIDLWQWHVNEEPILLDTQTNGGVKVATYLGEERVR